MLVPAATDLCSKRIGTLGPHHRHYGGGRRTDTGVASIIP